MDGAKAPFVYFDGVSAFGMLNGAIQIELAARTLHPLEDGTARMEMVHSGHLRCSPAAAEDLIRCLQKALEMYENPAQPAASVN